MFIYFLKIKTHNNYKNKLYYRPYQYISQAGLDDPTYAEHFKPQRAANQAIRFHHTSREKDAGQTVIPFFDAQPVEMNTAMPLNGMGMYHNDAGGYGGYIGLRLFTDSMDQYIDFTE